MSINLRGKPALIELGSMQLISSPDRNNAYGRIRRVLYWRSDFDSSRGGDVISLRVEVEIEKTGKKTHYKEGDVVIWSIPYTDILAGAYSNLKANLEYEGIPCAPPPELQANETVDLQPKPPKTINFNMVGAITKKPKQKIYTDHLGLKY